MYSYAFDNLAVAYVQRVRDAAMRVGRGPTGEKPIAGYPLQGGDYAIAASLWTWAKSHIDWSADSDICYEDPYKDFFQPILDRTLELDRVNGSEEDKQKAKGLYGILDEMTNVVLDHENRLFLAIAVVNALDALEGSARNIWDGGSDDSALKRVNDEFAKEKAAVVERLRKITEEEVAMSASTLSDIERIDNAIAELADEKWDDEKFKQELLDSLHDARASIIRLQEQLNER